MKHLNRTELEGLIAHAISPYVLSAAEVHV